MILLCRKVCQGASGTHNVGKCLRSAPENDRAVRGWSSLSDRFCARVQRVVDLAGICPNRADKAEVSGSSPLRPTQLTRDLLARLGRGDLVRQGHGLADRASDAEGG